MKRVGKAAEDTSEVGQYLGKPLASWQMISLAKTFSLQTLDPPGLRAIYG